MERVVLVSSSITTTRQQTATDRLLLTGWFLVLAGTPVYIFDSGLPQPGDLLMALLVIGLFASRGLRLALVDRLLVPGLLFAGYAVIINTIWWTGHGDSKFLLSGVYYIYNVFNMIFFVDALAIYNDSFLRVTRWGIIMAVVIEFLYISLTPSTAFRHAGTFNNPNQLAYWALLSMACLFIIDRQKVNWQTITILALLYFILLNALSKSGMICGTVLLGLLGVDLLRHADHMMRLKLAGATAVLTLSLQIAVLAGIGFPDIAALSDKVTTRFENIGEQSDDSVEGRGYDRIWRYPQYLLFGAGEGAFHRFGGWFEGHEMHSSLGTILFSYGIIGSALFAYLIYAVFRKSDVVIVMVLALMFIFSLVHQGLRFTTLWVFFGMAYGLCTLGKPSRCGRVRPLPEDAV
jgi:hypothetical protein